MEEERKKVCKGGIDRWQVKISKNSEGLVWFLLMAHQPLCVILCQSHTCKRTAMMPSNPS